MPYILHKRYILLKQIYRQWKIQEKNYECKKSQWTNRLIKANKDSYIIEHAIDQQADRKRS